MTKRQPGFTLLELMVAVIIIAILYMGVPDLFQQLRGTRVRRANADAAQIATALWGPTPDYQGFIGDIGIPSSSSPLYVATDGIGNDLVFPPSTTTFAPRQNRLGVTGGWNGPYAGFDPNALGADPWGTPWEITSKGQVHSFGEDLTSGTSDDIYSPVAGPTDQGSTGTIAVIVKDVDGSPLDSSQVSVYVWGPDPNATPKGNLQRIKATDPSSSDWVFHYGPVSPGRHAIEVFSATTTSLTSRCDGFAQGSCSGLYGHAVASVIGGATTTIEIQATSMVTLPPP